MAKTTIQSIRDAELKAQEILKKAASDKEAIFEDVKAQGVAYAEELIGAAKAKAQTELDAVEATRAQALEAAQGKAEGIIAGFGATAAAKRDEAIQIVIDEIA